MRPLFIGIPLILLIVAGFVAGMNLVPFSSPYFKWVIIGYVVLFPAVLAWTIIGTVRNVRRLIAGGDTALKVKGRRATAQVTAVRRRISTLRVTGTPRLSLYDVTLRVDGAGATGYDVKVVRPVPVWNAPPNVGDTVDVHVDPQDRTNLFVHWADSPATVNVGAGLDAVPPQLRALLQRGLDMAARLKPSMPEGGGRMPAPPEEERPKGLAREDYRPPRRDPPPAATVEGRARVEGFQPWPDGTYDLDLYVTPKGRASYKVLLRAEVPHERIEDLKRGLMLSVHIDSELSSRVEIDWAKSRT